MEWLVDEGFSLKIVRPMRRLIQREVEKLLAQSVLR